MSLYVMFGVFGIVFLILYIAKNLDEEHMAMKAFLTLFSFWIIYMGTAFLRQLIEDDVLLSTAIKTLADSLFFVMGIVLGLITAYSIIYLFYAFYKKISKGKFKVE